MKSVDYFDHPIFDRTALQIETPGIQELHEQITQWLWTGCVGGYITGCSRAGKSTALTLIANRLKLRSGEHPPTHLMHIPPSDVSTITSVYRNACISASLRQTTREQSSVLCNRFEEYLLDLACEGGTNRIVLLVDEMQRLTARQLSAFANIYDDLTCAKINLMTVFIGNEPDCNNLLNSLSLPEYKSVYGRFFIQKSKFHGLRSVKDVEFCLHQYDTLRYPENNGSNYTEYFIPEAVGKGFKMKELSHQLWSAFSTYKKSYSIESWGMQYFISTINTLLIDFLPKVDPFNVSDDVIHECIKISGLMFSCIDAIEQ